MTSEVSDGTNIAFTTCEVDGIARDICEFYCVYVQILHNTCPVWTEYIELGLSPWLKISTFCITLATLSEIPEALQQVENNWYHNISIWPQHNPAPSICSK